MSAREEALSAVTRSRSLDTAWTLVLEFSQD